MDGIITIKDTRDNVSAMQQFQRNEAVDTINNAAPVNNIDVIGNTIKSVVSVAGSVLNIAACFIPGGKIARIASLIAQPAILAAINSGKELLNGIFVNKSQEQICASMSDLAGNIQNISIGDRNLAQTISSKKERNKPIDTDYMVPERKARI